ncbi:MAG: GDP-mannose 4,6-dehydratase [Chloroflexi bacterium]|nr:GDP-mannose 4,6-dehydratase [Chloroflexota bacterium]
MRQGRKVLVTGGAGFIGSHVVDRLVELGHDVVVVDNLSTGKRRNLNPGARFYQMDLRDLRLIDVFRQERPQVVDHHAAQVSVPASVRDPSNDAQVNVLGAINLLEACRGVGIERFIYASTGGALYGEPRYLPCDEAHPVRPLSPYGASKFAVEAYLWAYAALCGFQPVVLRYSNVYGPRQEPHGEAGVIAIFTVALLEGRQPVIYGGGEQERDFVYVGDVANANLLALEHGTGEAYNIATNTATSVNQVVAHLKDFTSSDLGPRYEAARPGEVFRIRLDVTKAGRELGWQPRVSLDEGLKRTVAAFRSDLAAGR